MDQKNYLEKTLEELENDNWDNIPPNASSLIKKIYLLRRKKIKNFSVEDLRVCIGQEMGLFYLIPEAIKKLEQNILTEGDYYPGDLLINVLRINNFFWINNINLYKKLFPLLQSNINKINKFNTSKDIKKDILNNYNRFKNLGLT